MSWFKHKHRNVVVISTFHPSEIFDDDYDLRPAKNAYYSYERVVYPFCIECGELINEQDNEKTR